MITAFTCATRENLPQLLVALSCFTSYNPNKPVLVFYEEDTDISLIERYDVEFIPLKNPHLFLSAVDYVMERRPDIEEKLLYFSAETLVRTDISDFDEVDMGTTSLAAQSIWAMPKRFEEDDVYADADEALVRHRTKVGDWYFGIEFLLFNIDAMRSNGFPPLLPTWLGSNIPDAETLLNALFNDKPIMFMPSDLGVRVECVAHLTVQSMDLVVQAEALRHARVMIFPGEVTPWTEHRRFDRRVAQLPMAIYLEEVEEVEEELPEAFVERVRNNAIRYHRFFHGLPAAMMEIKSLLGQHHVRN